MLLLPTEPRELGREYVEYAEPTEPGRERVPSCPGGGKCTLRALSGRFVFVPRLLQQYNHYINIINSMSIQSHMKNEKIIA
jgi:hypothetical protein